MDSFFENGLKVAKKHNIQPASVSEIKKNEEDLQVGG